MEKNKIIESYKALKSERAKIESRWDTLHDYFMPATEEIQRQTDNSGEVYRNGQQTDEPILALRTLVSGFHSYLTSPASDWFMLRAKDAELNKQNSVINFLQRTEDVLRESINGTNFNTQQDMFYSSSACYGTAVMLIEEDEEDDLRFNTIPIKNIYIEEDSKERVSAFYIKYKYTPAQAIDRFGEENVAPHVLKLYKDNPSDQTKREYLLFVGKRHVFDETKDDVLNMPYEVKWLDVEGNKELSESGMRSMPFAYHRWTKRSETPYGYSPCMVALQSTKKLNEALRITMRGFAKDVDPPIMLPSKGYVNKVNLNPHAIMYKKQGAQGEAELFPTRSNLSAGDWMVNYFTEQVNRALYVDVVNALGGITKRMNDTEVNELIAEKMSQLGPAVGRFIDEFLNNVIARSLEILARRGKLPEPPEELGDGFEYKIEYVSPLALAQRNSELQSIQTTLGLVGQMAQFKPEVIDNIDFDSTARRVGDITGADIDIFMPKAEVEKTRGARQDAARQKQMIQAQQVDLDRAEQVNRIENNG